MTNQLLENTILLLVAVDPIALIPIFSSLTKGLKNQEIKKIYIQATFVSLIILSLFWLFGETVLNLMGISMSSFRIIGGLFLIAIAFQMVFEQRQDRRLNTAEVAMDDSSIQSIAIFPLSIPLIAGPGAMTAALLLAENRSYDPVDFILNFLPILVVVLIAGIAMWLSAQLSKRLGPTIITAVEKIFGIFLGALAIEFVVAGIIESFNLTF